MNRSENRARCCHPLNNIPKDIARLPVGHLQMAGGARRAVATFTTIGSLAKKLERSSACLSFSYAAWADICAVSSQLHSSQRQGRVDWDRFRRSRPLQADPDSIYFMSPKLRLVKNHHRTKEIGALHLSRRAVNALSHLQIRTIGHLIDHSRKGIHGLRNIGRLTQFEITEGLDALAEAVHDDGSVSWITYAVRQHFKILPSKERRRWEVRPFLEDLPMTLEAAVRIKYGEKAAMLFRQHTTQASGSVARLVDVGSSWGCTKQRASFLEKTIITMLRRVIWEDNYRGCSFRFREEYLKPLRALRTALQRRGNHQIAEADWNGLLHTTWHIDRSDVRFIEGLLLRLTESKLFKGRGANALPLTLPQSAKSGICDRAVRTIIGVLSADYPAGLGKRDLSRVLEEEIWGPGS